MRGGLQAARAQLLVGFDPAALYMDKLEQRFGHLGTFCAGLLGSCTIAVRWRPEVQLFCSAAQHLRASVRQSLSIRTACSQHLTKCYSSG